MRIFLDYFKPHMGLFVLDLSCALIASAVDLIFPLVARHAAAELWCVRAAGRRDRDFHTAVLRKPARARQRMFDIRARRIGRGRHGPAHAVQSGGRAFRHRRDSSQGPVRGKTRRRMEHA